MTVFSQSGHYNHRTTAASYVPTGSTTPTGPGNDCDRCHDPHDDSYWNFLKPEFKTQTYDQTGNVVTVDDHTHGAGTLYRWSPLIKGGNVCASCHEGALPDATTATVAKGIPGSRSVHPVYQAAGTMIWDTNNVGTFTWDSTTSSYLLAKPSSTAIVATTPVPGNVSTYPSIWPLDQLYMPASGDYQGTRVSNPTTGWMVSTKPDGTSVLMCESCHAPHGADNGTDSAGVHILNTMDLGASTGIPGLCSSCHSAPPSS